MAGELVPLVMLPRYTTLTGATDFTTIGMEVADYTSAILNIYRGPVANSGTFAITLEESTDQQSWSTCSGTTASYDPGSGTEGQQTATLKKRWFRVKITLTGTDPAVSCWALGFLEMRES
jgi:hypothetical protein